MVVCVSADSYARVIQYGMHKTQLQWPRLFLQACMAGIYVGMAGHSCTVFAGGFPTDPTDPLAISKVLQSFCYAIIFPVAFISIIFTGAELFTGNTMTMLICVLEKRVTWLDVAINWITSLIGNWLGTLIAAYFLSFLTGSFDGGIVQQYLHETAVMKTSYGWGQCFLRAIGCNTYVCLAVWFVISCDDAAGKIIALWFPIVAFAISGYQHIIANFYTLQVALMAGAPITVKDAVVWNFIPTLLGNMVGGCVLVGAVYWYNFYPSVGEIRGGASSLKPERTSSRSELQIELSEKRKTFFGVPPASVSDMAQRDVDRRLLSAYVQSSEASHVKSLKGRFLGGSSDAASPREMEVESRIGSEKPDIQVLSRVGEEEG